MKIGVRPARLNRASSIDRAISVRTGTDCVMGVILWINFDGQVQGVSPSNDDSFCWLVPWAGEVVGGRRHLTHPLPSARVQHSLLGVPFVVSYAVGSSVLQTLCDTRARQLERGGGVAFGLVVGRLGTQHSLRPSFLAFPQPYTTLISAVGISVHPLLDGQRSRSARDPRNVTCRRAQCCCGIVKDPWEWVNS